MEKMFFAVLLPEICHINSPSPLLKKGPWSVSKRNQSSFFFCRLIEVDFNLTPSLFYSRVLLEETSWRERTKSHSNFRSRSLADTERRRRQYRRCRRVFFLLKYSMAATTSRKDMRRPHEVQKKKRFDAAMDFISGQKVNSLLRSLQCRKGTK